MSRLQWDNRLYRGSTSAFWGTDWFCDNCVNRRSIPSTHLLNQLFDGHLFSFGKHLDLLKPAPQQLTFQKKFPKINFGVSRVDLFLVVYKGGLFILRPFFDPFPRYEIFIFGPKKSCCISETKRFDPLKSNSPLYKPHQMGPFQERNFFFFTFFDPKKSWLCHFSGAATPGERK